jgi:hypothetical protein
MANAVTEVAWWREPTKDQWYAYIAAWLGWTLDAFDFTVFLLIMVPIAKEFNVPLTEVTAVFTITLWMRLLGAVASGWVADRVGRKLPLMISIIGYSACNFIAGFSPTFFFLFFFRALLGIFMGAEWPARCGAGDGAVADPHSRLYERCAARLLGAGVCHLEPDLLAGFRPLRLARHAVGRRPPGVVGHLYPLLRQGAGGLG